MQKRKKKKEKDHPFLFLCFLTWGFSCNPLGNPPQTVVQAIPGEGTTGLDMPIMILDAVERKGIRDLSRGHSILDVLFVCKDENDRILKIIMLKQPEEFILHNCDPGSVSAIYHDNNSMSSSVISCP